MTPEMAVNAERNMALAYYLAWKQHAKHQGHEDIDELIGDAMVGLCEAADRYDPDKPGPPFGKYAQRRIKGAIVDGIRRRRSYHRAARSSPQPTVDLDALLGTTFEPSTPGFEDELLGWLETERIVEAVNRLTPKLRAAIAASYEGHGGLSALAREDGVSTSAAHQRRRYARGQLEPVIRPEPEPEAA